MTLPEANPYRNMTGTSYALPMGMKTKTVSKLPACDVCKLEFPHSEPNPARYDGPIQGQWGYMCETHKIVVPGLTTRLEVKEKA